MKIVLKQICAYTLETRNTKKSNRKDTMYTWICYSVNFKLYEQFKIGEDYDKFGIIQKFSMIK